MTPASVAPAAFLPLRPLELLVLTALSEQPMHGYGIWQAIVDQTAGAFPVEAGNLYRHIRRLDAERLIELVPRNAREADGGRGRQFRLTPLGKRVLAVEVDRLRAVVRIADRRLAASAHS